jgi:hypothetical protein
LTNVNFDVVPRGTIYLRGCRVAIEDDLSRPEEGVFAFAIHAPDPKSSPCCLAATTAEARQEWVEKLAAVCNMSYERQEEAEGVDALVGVGEAEGQELTEPEVPEVLEEETWRDLDPGVATSGLTPEMKQRVDHTLVKFLPYIEDRPEHGWKLLFENRHGVISYQRSGDGGKKMIKSISMLDHHPKQIFNLVADTGRRKAYEENVRYDERLKRCNPHTFVDYYAYEPVWPTIAREFLVLFHWRVLCRGDADRAIVMIGFSYPEANDLKPATSDHVRAYLEISLFLLELLPENRTKATRLLSYDLRGNIPRSLTNTIMDQQATLPHVISRHLKATEPHPPPRLSQGSVSNDVLARDIIERLPEESDGIDTVRRRLQFDDSMYSSVDDDEVIPAVSEDKTVEAGLSDFSSLLVAIILLSPLVIYNLMDSPGREIVFLLSAFMAVRTVVILKLGVELSESPTSAYTGSVSFSFTVNLRQVLRFLVGRRKDESSARGQELSVVPIVIQAVAKAADEIDGIRGKKTKIPLLAIESWFLRGKTEVSVLMMSKASEQQMMTLRGASDMTIEEIASKVDGSAQCTQDDRSPFVSTLSFFSALGLVHEGFGLGSCLVVVSPDSDHGHEIDIHVAPSREFNAVIVIGGIRLAKHSLSKSIASPTPRAAPRPLLAMTVTVNSRVCSISDCRRFAERLQELVEHVDYR